MADTQAYFRDTPMRVLVLKMAVPIIISLLLQQLYNLIDSLFVAQIDLQALTALGLAYPVQVFLISLGAGIGAGTNATVSRCIGAGEARNASAGMGNSIFLCLMAGLFALAFGLFACRPYLGIAAGDAAVFEYAATYLSIVTVFGFAQVFALVGQRMLLAIGKPNLGMAFHVAGIVANTVLDPIFIFVFGWGVAGAATSTVCGQLLSTVLVFRYLFFKQDAVEMRLSDIGPRGMMRPILKAGVPVTLASVLGAVMPFGMNQILKSEAVDLAVYTAYYKIWAVGTVPLVGLMQSIIPNIGYHYGAGLAGRLNEAARAALAFGTAVTVALVAVFELFAPQLIGVFAGPGQSGEFIGMGVFAIRVVAPTFVLFAVGQIATSLFQGMGQGMPNLVYAILHQLLLLLPAAWLLLAHGGPQAVWYAFWIAESVSLIAALILFRIYWKKLVG